MGVLAASSFINEAIVDRLEKNQRDQAGEIKDLRDSVLRLESDNKADQQFANAIRPVVLHDRLKGRRVLVLGFESTPGPVYDGVLQALKESAVDIDGVFILSEKLDLSSAGARQQAAEVVESTDDGVKAVQPLLVQRLAESVSGRKPGFLQRLIDGGLARTRSLDGVTFEKPAELASPETAVLILCPGNGSKLTKADTFLRPFIAQLSAAAVPEVLGEAGRRDLKTLPELRGDAGLRISTVDGADAAMGQVSVVLALDAVYRGILGHYGTGENATSVLPDIAPTPATVAR